ncbi:WhiB family transcriptional regulator [Streptomyces sp. NPDC058674]|uniref:WhiB family transcriptional regulator n=1 Tax=Streptomyces sp. NPDC058674 TaxID=3346592 RepID=UPI00364A3B12
MTAPARPLIGTGRQTDWRDRALCRQIPDADTEFFPVGTTAPFRAVTERTKEFCGFCPVRMACAEWALTQNMEFGIWGGLDEFERRSIRRNHSKKLNDPEELRAYLKGREKKSAQDVLVTAYLDRTEQDDQGHVRWLSAKTSISVAGRVLTPAQLAFEIGHGRRPEGFVKVRCSRLGCVAAEHLADGQIRALLRHGLGKAA